MSFCGYCGAQMPDDMRFCTECGKPLAVRQGARKIDPPVIDSPDEVYESQPEKVQADKDVPLNSMGQETYDNWTVSGMPNNNINGEWSDDLYHTIKSNTQKSKEKEKKQYVMPLVVTIAFILAAIFGITNMNNRRNTSEIAAVDANTPTETPVYSRPYQTDTTTQSGANTTSSSNTNATVAVERRERDGSMVNHRDAQIAYCKLSVPFYWLEHDGATSTQIQLFAENGKSIAVIQMEVTMNSSDDYSWFKDSSLRERVISERIVNAQTGQVYIDSAKYYEAETVAGILCETRPYDLNGLEITGKVFMVPSKDYKHMIYIFFMQSENTTFLYNDDFMRIIDSIELTDGSYTPSSGTSSSGSSSGSASSGSNSGSVDPNLKAFLDSYESFMDDYVSFMKKYTSDPTNALSMMNEYLEMLEKYEDFAAKADRYDTDKMSPADLDYYLEVMNRVNQKLLSVY